MWLCRHKPILEVKMAESQLQAALRTNQAALDNAVAEQNTLEQAKAYLERGSLLHRDGFLKDAALSFTNAIKLDADDEVTATALRKRARLCRIIPHLGEALPDLEKALKKISKLSKEYVEILREYGKALIAAKRYQEGIDFLKQAQALSPDENIRSELIVAITKILPTITDDVEMLKVYAGAGLFIKEIDKIMEESGRLSLWLEAARLGSLELVKYLAHEVEDKKVEDKEKNNALHYAAMEGHVSLISFLCQFIDINSKNNKQLTPLFKAARTGKTQVALELLRKGAKEAIDDTNVLFETIAAGQGCVLEELLDYSPSLLPACCEIGALFLKAIETRQLPILRILLNRFPGEVNQAYKQKFFLQYAVEGKFEEAVHLLARNPLNIEVLKKAIESAKRTSFKEIDYLNNQLALGVKLRDRVLFSRLLEIIKKLPEWKNFKGEEIEEQEGRVRKALLGEDSFVGALDELLSDAQFLKTYTFQDDNPEQQIEKWGELLSEALVEKKADIFIAHKKILNKGKKIDYDQLKIIIKNTLTFIPPARVDSLLSDNQPEALTTDILEEVLDEKSIAFCRRFEIQFDKAFGYFRAMSGGAYGDLASAPTATDKALNTGKEVASRLLPTVSIPTPLMNIPIPLGTISAGIFDLVNYFRHKYHEAKVRRMTDLFSAVTPYERAYLIRYVAEQLVDKYSNQIQHLMPGSDGVEKLADCAVARAVEYIISESDHQIAKKASRFWNAYIKVKSWVLDKEIPRQRAEKKALSDIFIDGIIHVTTQFPTDHERLATINGLTQSDNWDARGIFENTGIVTEDGERYAHPNAKIQEYGYCKGIQQEAKNRGLTLGPNSKQKWGEGRKWEKVEATPSLSSSTPHYGSSILRSFAAHKANQRKDDTHDNQRRNIPTFRKSGTTDDDVD